MCQSLDTVPLIEIGSDEMGIVEAIDGEPLPAGRIFAPDRAQNAHNNFQDPIAFIKEGGVTLPELPDGEFYWYNPKTEELLVRHAK